MARSSACDTALDTALDTLLGPRTRRAPEPERPAPAPPAQEATTVPAPPAEPERGTLYMERRNLLELAARLKLTIAQGIRNHTDPATLVLLAADCLAVMTHDTPYYDNIAGELARLYPGIEARARAVDLPEI